MRRIRKSRLVGSLLILVAIALGTVIGGDVIVKEGTIEGEVFKSTGCTVAGWKAVALGDSTEAGGNCSIAMGYATKALQDGSVAIGNTTKASGIASTAMGFGTEASGIASTAMGYFAKAGPASYTTAIGKNFTNNVQNSFAVGFGLSGVAFRVESGVVTVGNVATLSGDLHVGRDADANDFHTRCRFYDKDKYGKALDYLEDSSKTIKLTASGEKVYNHETDPEFLKTWITLKDYDKYTEQKVWNDELKDYESIRIYQTHQEQGTSLSMQAAWLRQCVYELKQENDQLKAELAAIKAKLGMQ